MKYFTIRDKKTKEPSLLAESSMSLWDSFEMAEYALGVYCDPQTDEVVTLREEPTEPCEWCSKPLDGNLFKTFSKPYPTQDEMRYVRVGRTILPSGDWHFCPNCGRRLTDDDQS